MKRVLRWLIPRRFRNWLRSPAKTVRWGLDELQYRLHFIKRATIRPGWTLLCHPAAYRCSYYAQVEDLSQAAEFDEFLAHCSEGMRLIDVGAHFGVFSLAAAHYGGPRAGAIAIDPSPVACEMTRIQARLNGVADRVRVVEAAVGDHAGSQRMIAVGVLADGYFATPTQDCPSSECTEAPATTVDALVAETGFAPTHLKIDVEGAEASVLRGAKQTLNGPDSPLLFVELHNKIVREQGGDPAGTLSLLRECGYAPVGADGSPLGDEAMLQPDIVRVRAVRARS